MKQGKIKYTDFLVATMDRKRVIDAELLFLSFKHFDIDNDGFINVEDLKMAIHNAGEYATQEEIEEMISDWDLDNNRLIDFEEFKKMMEDSNCNVVPEDPPSEAQSRRTSKRGSTVKKTIARISLPFS